MNKKLKSSRIAVQSICVSIVCISKINNPISIILKNNFISSNDYLSKREMSFDQRDRFLLWANQFLEPSHWDEIIEERTLECCGWVGCNKSLKREINEPDYVNINVEDVKSTFSSSKTNEKSIKSRDTNKTGIYSISLKDKKVFNNINNEGNNFCSLECLKKSARYRSTLDETSLGMRSLNIKSLEIPSLNLYIYIDEKLENKNDKIKKLIDKKELNSGVKKSDLKPVRKSVKIKSDKNKSESKNSNKNKDKIDKKVRFDSEALESKSENTDHILIQDVDKDGIPFLRLVNINDIDFSGKGEDSSGESDVVISDKSGNNNDSNSDISFDNSGSMMEYSKYSEKGENRIHSTSFATIYSFIKDLLTFESIEYFKYPFDERNQFLEKREIYFKPLVNVGNSLQRQSTVRASIARVSPAVLRELKVQDSRKAIQDLNILISTFYSITDRNVSNYGLDFWRILVLLFSSILKIVEYIPAEIHGFTQAEWDLLLTSFELDEEIKHKTRTLLTSNSS